MTELRPPRATRRGVIQGAGVLGAGAVVAACSGGSDGDSTGSSEVESSSGAGSAPGTVEVATADVPVDGGVVLKDDQVVVTQPQPGEYRAFTAVCTHRQCLVSEVSDGLIRCPCHGSQFSVVDGAVEHGPATQPLAQKNVTVHGETLIVS